MLIAKVKDTKIMNKDTYEDLRRSDAGKNLTKETSLTEVGGGSLSQTVEQGIVGDGPPLPLVGARRAEAVVWCDAVSEITPVAPRWFVGGLLWHLT